jgi:hypothetical protein
MASGLLAACICGSAVLAQNAGPIDAPRNGKPEIVKQPEDVDPIIGHGAGELKPFVKYDNAGNPMGSQLGGSFGHSAPPAFAGRSLGRSATIDQSPNRDDGFRLLVPKQTHPWLLPDKLINSSNDSTPFGGLLEGRRLPAGVIVTVSKKDNAGNGIHNEPAGAGFQPSGGGFGRPFKVGNVP